jgi:hypothetical protein
MALYDQQEEQYLNELHVVQEELQDVEYVRLGLQNAMEELRTQLRSITEERRTLQRREKKLQSDLRKIQNKNKVIALTNEEYNTTCEDKCTICWDSHKMGDTCLTSCKHSFGLRCIRQWWANKTNRTCPTCRASVPYIFKYKNSRTTRQSQQQQPIEGDIESDDDEVEFVEEQQPVPMEIIEDPVEIMENPVEEIVVEYGNNYEDLEYETVPENVEQGLRVYDDYMVLNGSVIYFCSDNLSL